MRAFRWLWASSVCGFAAGQISLYAIPLLALADLGADAAAVAALSAAGFLPYLLFGLHGGLLADRLDRRRIVLTANLGRFLLAALVPLLHAQGGLTLPLLLGIVLLAGTLSVPADAAFQAAIPQLVPPGRRSACNANVELLRSAVQIAGPLGAGALVHAAGGTGAMAANAGCFLLASLCALACPHPLGEAEACACRDDPGPGRESAGAALRAGLDFVLRSGPLRLVLLAYALWALGTSAFQAVSVVLLTRMYGLDAATAGLVFSIGNVGFLAGSLAGRLVFRRAPFGRPVRLGAGCITAGLLLIALLGAALPLPACAAGLLLAGGGAACFSIGFTGLRQQLTPPGMMGRASSIVQTAGRGMIPLGALLAGLLSTGLPPSAVVWLAVVLAGLACLVLARKPALGG